MAAAQSNPLVRSLGLQEVLQRDAAASVSEPTRELSGDLLESALAGHVRLAWSRNKLSKWIVDRKLLADLRARRGVYSPDEVALMQTASGGGMNIIYAPLTETKCRAASAWIREIVLPVGEQPWGIDPSPRPDLPKELKQSVVNQALTKAKQVMAQAHQAGAGVMDAGEFRDMVRMIGDKLREDAEKSLDKMAKDRAERMEKVIGDRLEDGGYAQAMDGFVEDFVTFPAAILKGPIYSRRKELHWEDGWKPVVRDVPIQTWYRVSPFDAYPAAAATSPQKGDFIERTRFRRDELYDYKGMPGWKDDQIDGALRDYTNGHLEAWLWTESERQRLEQETTFMWLAPPGVIDALCFWGSVPGWKLMSWGLEGLEETKDYECNVVICGSYVLYAALNPSLMGTRPYRKACYDEIPGAFWGRSIPDLMRTPQQMCNSTLCRLADNLSIASGPQVWVHADRFADGEQSMEMFPWKLWQLKSDPTQGVNPGIGFFQPDDRSGPLMAVYEKFSLEADDATGIPRYTYGNEQSGGSADTLGGLSMLMNNAAKGLRRAISNIDGNVIAPTINDTFVHEMLYNPDESIKGDCIVVPRGAAAILIRESAQQRRLQFLTLTANPIDAPIIGPKHRAALLRATAAAMDLPADDVVPTDDEIDAKMQADAQAMQANQEQLQQMEAAKEQAIAQRENMAQQTKALGGIVQTAVAKGLDAHRNNQGASPLSLGGPQ
jgi:hypothetical protein